MIEIQLPQGYVTMVDDIDSDLNDIKWNITKRGINIPRFYADCRTYTKDKQRTSLRMHRVILERVALINGKHKYVLMIKLYTLVHFYLN